MKARHSQSFFVFTCEKESKTKSDTGEEETIMSRVITISREFGSGGRDVGFRLAEKLGSRFTIKRSFPGRGGTNISEDVFHSHDEVIGNKERIDHDYVSVNPFSPLYEVPVQTRYLWPSPRLSKNWLRRAHASSSDAVRIFWWKMDSMYSSAPA